MAITLARQLPFPLVGPDHPHTTGDLTYFTGTADGEAPYHRLYQPEAPELVTNAVDEVLPGNKIYDLRPLLDAGLAGDVNVTGFQVVPESVAATQMREEDFADDNLIRTKYYAEIDTLLKKVTGATRTVIFDHTIRRKEKKGEETEDDPNHRKPVGRVHIDQTPASGRKRVYRHTGEDAERLLQGKASLINVWRPLRGPVLDAPLAVADARTLHDEDLINSRLIYRAPAPEGETSQITFSPRHQWFYLSEMGPNEALLLRCWGNEENTGARTPHTGFEDDKYKGVDVPLPRQSIEVRVLVFHEPQE